MPDRKAVCPVCGKTSVNVDSTKTPPRLRRHKPRVGGGGPAGAKALERRDGWCQGSWQPA